MKRGEQKALEENKKLLTLRTSKHPRRKWNKTLVRPRRFILKQRKSHSARMILSNVPLHLDSPFFPRISSSASLAPTEISKQQLKICRKQKAQNSKESETMKKRNSI